MTIYKEKDKNLEIIIDEKNIQELTNLLRENIEIYKKDRELALQNYYMLKQQLDDIRTEGHLISEDAALEKQINIALGLVFKSADRLDAVIKTITQIILTQVNIQSKERIANVLKDTIPHKPVNFSELLIQHEKNEIKFND